MKLPQTWGSVISEDSYETLKDQEIIPKQSNKNSTINMLKEKMKEKKESVPLVDIRMGEWGRSPPLKFAHHIKKLPHVPQGIKHEHIAIDQASRASP